MKKSFFTAAGLMLFTLAFSSCQKEPVESAPAASEPNFTLFAQPSSATKTTNEGLNTKWAEGDAINVFHAEAGTTKYVSDGQFSLKDTESGKFDGTVSSLTADASYDWYAFYPYISQITTPANKSGYVTVGGTSQTQKGNNSMEHISGKACPLYGVAKGVAYDETPSIEMNHLTSVIKVNVTNNSGEDLNVSSIAFTGTEDIVGTYYINFAASPVTYTSSGDKYVSETATLTVNNGEAIANGSSAAFYIAVKPFTAKTGSTLKLAVNGYEKTIDLPSDVTFTAGHIRTLGFNVDKKIPKKVWTIVTDASTLAAGDRIVIASNSKGKVAAKISSDYLEETSTQFSSDLSTIESISAEASVFTLGGSPNSWTLSNSDGALLGATAAKKLAFGKGTTSWKITISESNDATIQNGNSSYGKILHNVGNTRFTTYTSATNVSMLLPQIYRLESDLPALATPTVDYEIQNSNSIFVTWSEVDGAKDYTVTCGDQKVTVTGDEYTFEGLAYSTEYKISVVANPSDNTENAKSAPGTATVTTGANPSATVTTITLGPDWNGLFGTNYSGTINVKANALSLIGTSGEVTISVKNGTSTSGYVKTSDLRAYKGYTITFSVPNGKSITKISTTKGGKSFTSGITADIGSGKISNNSFTWSGSSQSIKLTISGTVSFDTISIIYK